MANEVSLFSGKVPAHLQGREITETTKALLGGGSNLKRISIRGSVFRMMLGSEEVSKNKDRSMNMVIIASAPGFARTFYKGRYVEGENAAPTCWSDDGEAPSTHVKDKQAKTCATCPQNIKGSGDQENSRACRYSARVAVLLDGDMEGDVYGLQVPATSLFGDVEETGYYALQKYARMLAGHGYDISTVITEVMFDTDAATPKLMFKAVRPLTEDEWEIAQKQMTHLDIAEHTGPREYRESDDTAGKKDPMATEGESDEDEAARKAEAAKRKKQADERRKKREAEMEEKLAAAKAEGEEEEGEEEEEPVVTKNAKTKDEPVEADDLQDLLDEWGEDD